MLVFNAMKKYIVRIILFFAIVVLVDIIVGLAGDYLQAHAKGGDTKAINDLVKKDQHDILILGSSRAHHHYDTPFLSDTLNLDVYNAGYDGNGVLLAYGILQMVLERYEPKLVVFDVEPSFDINVYAPDNNNTRYLKFLKPYYQEPGIEQIFRDVSNKEWYKVHSGLIRYNTDIISKLTDCFKGASAFPCGYAPMSGEMKEDREMELETPIPVDSLKLSYVGHLIDLARSRNIPIVLVSSPKYGAHNSEVLNPVKEICKSRGVKFLDFYADKEMVTHKEWFKEPMHLNAAGARIYTNRMLGEITSILSE